MLYINVVYYWLVQNSKTKKHWSIYRKKHYLKGTLCKDCAIEQSVKIPPHRNRVATVPREILMRESYDVACIRMV